LGVCFFEASRSFSLRLKDRVRVGRHWRVRAAQIRHACAKLDSKVQELTGQLRCFVTSTVQLLDKSKLFHKIFMSLLN
jgi:hypothetical protein